MARALIFIDAGAFVARYRSSDEFHEIAVRAWSDLESKQIPCVTSSLVLSEAAEFLRRNWGSVAAAGRMRVWLSSEHLTVLRSDRDVELEAAD